MFGASRRQLLARGAAALALGSMAGCLGGRVSSPSDGSAAPTAQASFFVFGDFATKISGDIATAETLVPIGQHGHGWEPGPRIREAILAADLFVYGMAGFQPWADDVVRDLRADDANVRIVAAGDRIDLIESAEDHDHDGHEEGVHDDREDEAHDGDEHALEADPHFWLDPIRAMQAAGNIQAGYAAVDPDNATTYEASASVYQDRLADLHGTFETGLSDRSRDVILVAGHDAFQYLHDRYGFEIESLSGLAPDDTPSTRDVARAQQLIEEHELAYVCADPLESQRAADQLVAETDARAVLPLTAMPGRTTAWKDDGWGYLEVMERVNLPTLQRALDAS